jgi:transcriptional regulator with XRE-family HTH domain
LLVRKHHILTISCRHWYSGAMAPLQSKNAPQERKLGEVVRAVREAVGMSARELARTADISHTQVSRLEAGQVAKPSREVLVGISRALDRNPQPLLIVAGHMAGSEAQEALRPVFREGAELPHAWPDDATFDLERAKGLVRDPKASDDDLRRLSSDVFGIWEADEMYWDDSYELALARGGGAKQLREVMSIWRYIGTDLRSRWLDYGRQLRRIADLDYLAYEESERKADEITRNDP